MSGAYTTVGILVGVFPLPDWHILLHDGNYHTAWACVIPICLQRSGRRRSSVPNLPNRTKVHSVMVCL